MNVVKSFWQLVREKRSELSAIQLRGEAIGQPPYNPHRRVEVAENKFEDLNTVILMSVHNQVKGSADGSIVEATIHDAGKFLVEQTHRLATASEIEAHDALHRERKFNIERKALEKKTINLRTVVDAPISPAVTHAAIEPATASKGK